MQYASQAGGKLRKRLSKRRAHHSWAEPWACNFRVTRAEKGPCCVSRLILRRGGVSHVGIQALIEDGGYILRAQDGFFSCPVG